jgi:hypothetical protein
MAERILFPSAVTAVVTALNAQLPDLGFTGVPARGRIPRNPDGSRPDRFVRVLRTGGPRGLVVDSAQITVEAWAQHDTDAEDLALACRAIVGAMEATVIGGVTIYDVSEFSGPGLLPDPQTDQSRYTFTTSVQVRGAAA